MPSDRKFGLFFAVVFFVVALWISAKGVNLIGAGALVVSAIFALLAVFKSVWLAPLNRLWMALGLLLGRIVSPLVLGLIYVVMFVPVGLAMRLFGRDELRLRQTGSGTCWKVRSQEQVAGFKNQF